MLFFRRAHSSLIFFHVAFVGWPIHLYLEWLWYRVATFGLLQLQLAFEGWRKLVWMAR
jgi:hypothetical protein